MKSRLVFFTKLSWAGRSSFLFIIFSLLVSSSTFFFSNRQLIIRAEEPNTFPSSPPEAPNNLQIQVNNTLVTAQWEINNPTGPLISDYRIEYRMQGDTIWQVHDDGISTNTSVTTTLPYGIPQVALEARVKSIGADGQVSGPSNVVQYVIGPIANPKPLPPITFGVLVSNDNVFALWTPASPQPDGVTVVDYRIEYTFAGSGVWNVYDDGVSTYNFDLAPMNTNISPALHLTARVRAVASNGEVSAPSPEFNYTIGHD